MKLLLLTNCLFIALSGFSQDVFTCKKGWTSFYSEAPLEDIEAKSDKTSSLFNTGTGEVAVLIYINSFEFDNALMQEHFNENYMESEKFPKAVFNGKIKEPVNPKPGTSEVVNATGDLTIHGVTKTRTIPVTLNYKNDGSIEATSEFMVRLEDHKIKIPKVVFHNIAEEVRVLFNFTYIRK